MGEREGGDSGRKEIGLIVKGISWGRQKEPTKQEEVAVYLTGRVGEAVAKKDLIGKLYPDLIGDRESDLGVVMNGIREKLRGTGVCLYSLGNSGWVMLDREQEIGAEILPTNWQETWPEGVRELRAEVQELMRKCSYVKVKDEKRTEPLLSENEKKLLAGLLVREGGVWKTEEMEDELWEGRKAGRNINQLVFGLREKLKKIDSEWEIITKSRVGLMIVKGEEE